MCLDRLIEGKGRGEKREGEGQLHFSPQNLSGFGGMVFIKIERFLCRHFFRLLL